MNIIPGAAYVSPSLGIPLIALTDKLLMYRGGRKGSELMFGLSGKQIPEDLTLVYAPGDRVMEGNPDGWRVVIYKGEIE